MTTLTDKQKILIGKDLKLNRDKLQDGEVCCLITGVAGAGKTVLTKKIIDSLNKENTGQIIVIDFEGDYYELRNNKFKIISLNLEYIQDWLPEYAPDFNYNFNEIQKLCNFIFSNEDVNYVIDLSGLERTITQAVITEFAKNLIDFRGRNRPCHLIIESLSSICYRFSNSESDINCKNAIVKLQKFQRSRLISLFFISQRIISLPKDITSECNTILMGKISIDDFERNALYIGVNENYFDRLVNYNFIAYGYGFDLNHPLLFDDSLTTEENDFETIKKEIQKVRNF